MLGVYQAIGQYYRLAATDSVAPDRRGRGRVHRHDRGIIAALVAPTLSIWSKDLFAPVLFAGSFLAVTGLSLLSIALIIGLTEEKRRRRHKLPPEADHSARSRGSRSSSRRLPMPVSATGS